MPIVSPLHENTGWVEESPTYFIVSRIDPPGKVSLKIFEDDEWIKGIYYLPISLNDVEFIPGDRWMKPKKKHRVSVHEMKYCTCITIFGDVDIQMGKDRMKKNDIPICEIYIE